MIKIHFSWQNHVGRCLYRCEKYFQLMKTDFPKNAFSNQVVQPDLPMSELQELANRGSDAATLVIARRYAEGRGVEPDAAKALSYFRLAADRGYAPALSALGCFYADGVAGEPDWTLAAHYHQLAAEKGFRYSMYKYGVLLCEGIGVPADPVAGVAWVVSSGMVKF